MSTLYREYRPQNFKELVGQNHIKLTLEQEIKTDKIVHAYLFCGPRGIGKTTVARVFAKAVNCLKRAKEEHEPCNKCQICNEITSGRTLDVIEIDAASHTGVENVRDNIIANARVVPSRCKYKVFIIDEVHMLSISAVNALLKVIAEPPEYVIFILCTTEIHKVPTTIISRCQRFDFRRISLSDVLKKLQYIVKAEKIKIDRSILEAIARHSEGHMRDAESVLGQITSIGGHEITQEEADLVIPRSDLGEAINLINYLAIKDSTRAISLINKLLDEGVDLKVFTNDLIELLRKILLYKINPNLGERFSLELGEDMEAKISQVSQGLLVERLLQIIEAFIKAGNEIKASFIVQLPLELAIAELCLASTKTNIPGPTISGIKNNPTPKPAASKAKTMSRTGNISQDKILARWNEVLAKIKQYNHSLFFILRVCQPRDLNGQELCLAFKYKFHKDRVENDKIKSLVERVLQEVYDTPLIIKAVIDENLAAKENTEPGIVNKPLQSKEEKKPSDKESEKNKDNGNMIDNLLKTFGGKIIE